MLMSSLPSLLFSAAGQVDEEETEAKKGIQMENKLQKRWLLLERRKDTQRGVAGGGGGCSHRGMGSARLHTSLTEISQEQVLMQVTSAGILGTLRQCKHLTQALSFLSHFFPSKLRI